MPHFQNMKTLRNLNVKKEPIIQGNCNSLCILLFWVALSIVIDASIPQSTPLRNNCLI